MQRRAPRRGYPQCVERENQKCYGLVRLEDHVVDHCEVSVVRVALKTSAGNGERGNAGAIDIRNFGERHNIAADAADCGRT